MNTNNKPTTKDTTTMNTTHTFTYLASRLTESWAAWHEQPEYVASNKFVNDRAFKALSGKKCTSLDMELAHVVAFDDLVVGDDRGITQEDGQIVRTVTTGRRWIVCAPMAINGEQYVACNLNQYISNSSHLTEAAAIKHMHKMQKVATKWHEAEGLRRRHQDMARVACLIPTSDPRVFSPIDPTADLGDYVLFHGMGKHRVGVIVDKTPTMWVLVYTTPSNPNVIRTAKTKRV